MNAGNTWYLQNLTNYNRHQAAWTSLRIVCSLCGIAGTKNHNMFFIFVRHTNSWLGNLWLSLVGWISVAHPPELSADALHLSALHSYFFDLIRASLGDIMTYNWWSTGLASNVGSTQGFDANSTNVVTISNSVSHSAYGSLLLSELTPAPIPTSFWLFISGLLGVLGVLKRKYT